MTKQALYRHFDADGQLLYVGISLCPFTRTRQHGMAANWFDEVVRVEIERFDTRSQAEQAEYAAIRNEQPIHNRTFNRKERAPPISIRVINASLEYLPNVSDIKPKPELVKTPELLAWERQAIVRKQVSMQNTWKG